MGGIKPELVNLIQNHSTWLPKIYDKMYKEIIHLFMIIYHNKLKSGHKLDFILTKSATLLPNLALKTLF